MAPARSAGTGGRGRPQGMARLAAIALALPEAERVDVEAWDGEPTFRVRGKNFVFASKHADVLTVKLPPDEAAAVCATVPGAAPTGYGLGRHGWVTVRVPADAPEERWQEIEEWVVTSCCLVAPRRLARVVEAQWKVPDVQE